MTKVTVQPPASRPVAPQSKGEDWAQPPVNGVPRLTYFNARGRAEVVRIMCAEAGFEYEDYRFRPNMENECRAPEIHSSRPGVQCLCQTHGPGNDEFVRFRAAGKSITGQVPLMEIDGLQIVQTSAICRYLANKLHLAGTTPAEAAYSDVVAATLDDLYIYMVQSMINRKVDANFYVDQWPKVGAMLEKMAATYSTSDGHFVGSKLTWVDCYGFHMFTRLAEGWPGALDDYPKLKAIATNVANKPRVRAWLETRVKREKELGNYIDWLL